MGDAPRKVRAKILKHGTQLLGPKTDRKRDIHNFWNLARGQTFENHVRGEMVDAQSGTLNDKPNAKPKTRGQSKRAIGKSQKAMNNILKHNPQLLGAKPDSKTDIEKHWNHAYYGETFEDHVRGETVDVSTGTVISQHETATLMSENFVRQQPNLHDYGLGTKVSKKMFTKQARTWNTRTRLQDVFETASRQIIFQIPAPVRDELFYLLRKLIKKTKIITKIRITACLYLAWYTHAKISIKKFCRVTQIPFSPAIKKNIKLVFEKLAPDLALQITDQMSKMRSGANHTYGTPERGSSLYYMSRKSKTKVADRNCVVCKSVFHPLTIQNIVCSPACKNKRENQIKAKYRQRPEVRKKIQARQRAYFQRPEVKAKTKQAYQEKRKNPEYRAKCNETGKLWRLKNPERQKENQRRDRIRIQADPVRRKKRNAAMSKRYHANPGIKEYHKKYFKVYYLKPGVKEKILAAGKKFRAKPENKAKIAVWQKEYQRTYRRRKK